MPESFFICFGRIVENFYSIFNTRTCKRFIVKIALAVFVIYFTTCGVVKAKPSIVEGRSFIRWQVMPKLTNNSIERVEFGSEISINIFRPIYRIWVESGKLIVKSCDDFSRSVFLGGNNGKLERKPVTDPCPEKCSDNSATESYPYKFIGSKLQFWASIIGGSLLGYAISAIFIIPPFVRFLHKITSDYIRGMGRVESWSR